MFFDPVAVGGVALSVLVATVAGRALQRPSGFYESEVYGLDCAMHRRIALAACAAAVGFTLAACVVRLPSTVMLGIATLAAILYLSSFLRGAEDQEPLP